MVATLALSAFLGTALAGQAPSTPATEATEWGVELMRPDQLVAWDYGATAPQGWRLEAGELVGTAGASPLVSGFTFGDFELRLQWSAMAGGACEVRLAEVGSDQALVVTLREGPGCGTIARHSQALHVATEPIGPAPPPGGPARWRSATLIRTGDQLRVLVDGQLAATATIATSARYGLGLAVTGGGGRFRHLRVEEPRGAAMFNGKDLQGWWTPGVLSAWQFDHGTLILRGLGGNYLRSRKEFGNFTLSLEYRIQKGGNSGIGIRTPAGGWPSTEGMELQIWDVPADRPLDKHAPMAIYGNVPPLGRADRSGQWNRLVIKADGPMISAWVNGQLVQHCNTAWHPELKHRFRRGWIGIQDHGARIEVRNMCILEAPQGSDPVAWQTPRPSAWSRLLDRLMNSQQLAHPDGIQSHSLTARIANADSPAVLADLPGPGALVRIARNRDQGTLAFYFDGEMTPRLECRPGEMLHALPHLTEDANPVLTCLGFRHRLRVVLRQAKSAEYQLDYVTFPSDLAIPSWAPDQPGVPPSWLAAVSYRRQQFGWGVHREHDPYRRVQASTKVLAPGTSETLVRLDGAGVVQWIKLLADKKLLDHRDLWLEVFTDGRSQPDVATPVRYWFPGLAGQGNYQNFVVVDRGGVTNLLAMPYSRGIKLALANRGARPIRNVGLAVSVDARPPAGSLTHRAMRLHAVYVPSGSRHGPAEAKLSNGAGRWVGLVCEAQAEGPVGVACASIDGQELASGGPLASDLFFGPPGDFRTCGGGRRGRLAWRWLLLEPVDFQKSLELRWPASPPADRLVICYLLTPP